MSLLRRPCTVAHQRFPRVSGDEPDLAAEAGIKNRFSPRERG